MCFKDDTKFKKFDGKDIIGFTFGGISSRFWVAKNRINLLPRDSTFKDEHFCWNMITIFLKQNEKQINLIIPNQMQMDTLMLLLLQIQYDNDKNNKVEKICGISDQDEKEWELKQFSYKLNKKKAPDFH